jgi:hypothetical protein
MVAVKNVATRFRAKPSAIAMTSALFQLRASGRFRHLVREHLVRACLKRLTRPATSRLMFHHTGKRLLPSP